MRLDQLDDLVVPQRCSELSHVCVGGLPLDEDSSRTGGLGRQVDADCLHRSEYRVRDGSPLHLRRAGDRSLVVKGVARRATACRPDPKDVNPMTTTRPMVDSV